MQNAAHILVLTAGHSGDPLYCGDMLLRGGNIHDWWDNQQNPFKHQTIYSDSVREKSAIGNQILGGRSLSAWIAGTVLISS